MDTLHCEELRGFDWNPNVESKLVDKHGVYPEEVEEACYDPQSIWHWEEDRRYLVFGCTGDGRYLFCLVRLTEDCLAHPITARDMNREQRTYYVETKRL